MDRPSSRRRARRRFHTDRIVAVRRARYLTEVRAHALGLDDWLEAKLAYGRLASTDPWDCGRARCGVCHHADPGRRTRDERAWRRDWGV